MIRRNVRQGRCGRLQKSPSELARFDLLPFFTSGAAPAVAAVAATMLLFACAGFHNPGVSADGSTAPQQTFDATQAERVIMWPTPTKLRASEPAAAAIAPAAELEPPFFELPEPQLVQKVAKRSSFKSARRAGGVAA